MPTQAQVAALYSQYLGRGFSSADDAALGGVGAYGGMSTDQFLNSTILPSAEYKGRSGGGSADPVAAARAQVTASQKSVSDTIAANNAARDALLAKQDAQQQGLFDQYSHTLGGQETSSAMYDRLNKELGVPDMAASAQTVKNQIYSVKDLLDRLDEDVNSRTAGTNTSAAQADRIKASEGGKLNDTLGRLTTGLQPLTDQLTGAMQLLGTKLQLGQADETRALQPLELQINAISDKFARQISGFNQDSEDTLNGLMTKLQQDGQLYQNQWQQAADLAKQEQDFQHQKELVAMQLSAKSAAGTGGGATIGGSSGGGSSAAPTSARQTAFQNELASVMDNYNSKYNAGYTERTAIPKLVRDFPEFSNNVASMVYAYRKAVYGE